MAQLDARPNQQLPSNPDHRRAGHERSRSDGRCGFSKNQFDDRRMVDRLSG